MATMMERARSAPLSLFIDKREDMSPRKTALIADNLHRFKSFDLHIPNVKILELFSGPVPLLEHLKVTYFGDAIFAFLSEFLTGSAPNLRHIELITYTYIPWTSGLFANLITLYILQYRERGLEGPEAPSLGVLLSALAKMPGLETLILLDCLPPPTSSTTIAHVNLPNLDFLSTRGPLRSSTCSFRQMALNASATVRVHITSFYISKEAADELFAIFPSRLYIAPSPTVYALKFDWQGPFVFKADAWTVQQAAEIKNEDAKIKLTLSWDFEGTSPLDLIWACFPTFASPQLHSFRIVGDHIVGWDIEVWRKLTRVSPDLRRLALGNDTVQYAELFEALRPPDGQDIVPTDCCLPALSYLELSVPPNHPVPTPDGETAPLSEVLSNLLSMRATAGCPVPELVFVSSSEDFVGDWSKSFRDAVPGIIVRTVERGEEVM
ncbi:hypothetical protein BD779DRAFT_457902 [Infundibulicybe gibba]|nr:hypothetical protein BD779DRAFT_457902 [Infundibulicybe gibba]